MFVDTVTITARGFLDFSRSQDMIDRDGDQDLALWTLGGLVYRENTSAPSAWTRLRLLERDGLYARFWRRQSGGLLGTEAA